MDDAPGSFFRAILSAALRLAPQAADGQSRVGWVPTVYVEGARGWVHGGSSPR